MLTFLDIPGNSVLSRGCRFVPDCADSGVLDRYLIALPRSEFTLSKRSVVQGL